MTEQETVAALRKLLDELAQAPRDGRHRYPTDRSRERDDRLAEELRRIDLAQSSVPLRESWNGGGSSTSHDQFEDARRQARQRHHDAVVVDRENGKRWENTALELRQQRKRAADLRKINDITPTQRLELDAAEKASRKAAIELAVGRPLRYADTQAIAHAGRHGALDAIDRRVSADLVADALKSGPTPVGSDAPELLSPEEREAALFEQAPAT